MGFAENKLRPLIFRSFFQKHSENQKWASQKMLRPLIFRSFFRNIQKIKNGLSGKQAAPLIRPKLRFVHLPPGGKAISKAIIKNCKLFVIVRYETGDARPRGEGYIKGDFKNCKLFVIVRNETPCGCVTKHPEGALRNTLWVRYETGDARPRGEKKACSIGEN